MKKFILLLMFVLFWFFIGGSWGGIENNAIRDYEIKKIKREIYLKDLIKQIEAEAEVTIPDYVEIK